MLSRVNGGVVWMDAGADDDEDAVSWTRGAAVAGADGDRPADDMGLSTFRSMLEDDWYVNAAGHHDFHHGQEQGMIKEVPFSSPAAGGGEGLLLNAVDSSASCSPSSVFNLDPKTCLSSLLNSISSSHPFDVAGFDLGCDPSLLPPPPPPPPSSAFLNNGFPDLSPNLLLNDASGFAGVFDNPPPLLFNRSKLLRPLEIFPPVGAQPTLFQKRAAQRLSSEKVHVGSLLDGKEEDDIDDASMDVSGLNYDSDEVGGGENNYINHNIGGKGEETGKNGGNSSNVNSSVTAGDPKGKKKGMPAKNLMAERRRRKKLNDRLYMLRSVVPKISKVSMFSFTLVCRFFHLLVCIICYALCVYWFC